MDNKTVSHSSRLHRLVSAPRRAYLATLGLAGSLPALIREAAPEQISDLLTAGENLFNRCVERGELIVERRSWRPSA